MYQEEQFDMFGGTDDFVEANHADNEVDTVVPIKKKSKARTSTIDFTQGVPAKVLEPTVLALSSVIPETKFKYEGILVSGCDNSVKVMKNLHWIRTVLESIIGKDIIDKFSIDVDTDKKVKFVIPISGGADSCGIAMIMRALFPNVDFIFVFTDTMAESPDLYYQLEKMEEYLGIRINRIQPEYGLYQLIDKNNGFMPNQKARYCTADLKIKPMLQVMADNYYQEDTEVHQYVGIRFDEDRGAMVAEDKGIYTHMPYMNLKMTKSDVYRLLDATVGLPDFYKYRTRSGCIGCFFMRRSEKTAQLYWKPDEFAYVASREKITANDRAKYGLHWHDEYRKAVFEPGFSLGFTKSQQLYKVPDFVDVRTRDKDNFDLMSQADKSREKIFVGVAMYTPDIVMGCNNHMVYKTELAVYSFRKHNLVDQMNTWYEHERTNYLLKGFDSVEDMERDINLVCFEIDLPSDLGKAIKSQTDEGSFTNAKGEAYAQIEVITRIAHTVLTFERTYQDFKEHEKFLPEDESQDPLLMSYMEAFALSLKKDYEHQKRLMNMLGLPAITAHHIDTPTADDLEEMALRRLMNKAKRKGKEKPEDANMEAIQACTVCSM